VKNRRLHRRFKLPELTAMVRVPESALDYYFHVDNLSLSGLALVTRNTEAFPLSPDTVVDIEIYLSEGTIVCRAVIARLIPDDDGKPCGFGVKLYGHTPAGMELWKQLIESLERISLEAEEESE
jgi:hypothetical protein